MANFVELNSETIVNIENITSITCDDTLTKSGETLRKTKINFTGDNGVDLICYHEFDVIKEKIYGFIKKRNT